MEETKKSKLSVLTIGLIKENPVLVLLLGTCPTLAISTNAMGSLGMGISAMLVLICSNMAIAALKNIIPDKVRIPSYIVIIAGFVTIVQMLLKAYAPALDSVLGIYIQLIVVNCIILGRAEMFANKNSVLDSALDGIGMGIGFTIAIVLMGSIREIFGTGTWFGITLTANFIPPMEIMTKQPAGFFVYGVMIAAVNYISKGKAIKRKSFGCEGCGACNTNEEGAQA